MKKLLLVPILTISLLVGCAKGNSYVPEDITLDAWLDGAEKTHNNMYNIYPEKQRPVDMDGNDAVDWDNYIIKTIKENVTSTTPRKKINNATNDEEHLWYFLRNPKGKAQVVTLSIFEKYIITNTEFSFAGSITHQILYYDLQPSAGERIIEAAKKRILDSYEAEAYETETAKREGTIENIIEQAKKIENEPVIKYQGSSIKDTNRSFLSDLTYEECTKWTEYFKEDSDDKNIGPFLFTYTIKENLMLGLDGFPHDRNGQDRYYLTVKHTYKRAFPHHDGEIITYYNFYEVPKSTVNRLEQKILVNY